MLGIIFLLSGTPTILREVLAKLLLHAITIRGDIEADDHKKFIEIASDIMQEMLSIPKEDTSVQPSSSGASSASAI